MKVLAENGPCTARDIAEKDGLSNKGSRLKTRQDEYNRIINGVGEKIQGLIKKDLITEQDKVSTSKPTRRYKLTLFGIFYTIHLFETKMPIIHQDKELEQSYNDIHGSDNLKSILLQKIVKNYDEYLPLIFGKWDYLRPTVRSLLNILISFAHYSEFPLSNALFNTRAITISGWNSKNVDSDEISMWFYASLANNLPPNVFRRLVVQEKEIKKWYENLIPSLLKANREERLRIKFINFVLIGNNEKAEKVLSSINKLQGVDV